MATNSVYKFKALASCTEDIGSKTYERTLDILKASHIYLPSFKKLNDPFEVKFSQKNTTRIDDVEKGYEFISKVTGRPVPELRKTLLAGSGGDRNRAIKNFNLGLNLPIFSEYIAEYYGALSFCKSASSVLMWAHYCQEHMGICIEFDHTKFDLDREWLKCGSVKYHPVNEFPKYQAADFHSDKLDETAKAILTSKYKDWEYEDKWRIISAKRNSFFEFRSDAIVRVILGPSILEKAETDVKEICEAKGIKVSKASFSKSKYQIVW